MSHKKVVIQELIDDDYVPSSVERKKAVLMYFFVWIVVALSGEWLSIYEFFHLRQSLGRWMLFFLSLLVTSVFIFIWYLRVVPVLLFLIYIFVRLFFIKQAREWRYTTSNGSVVMPIFFGLWDRITQVFELDVDAE